MRYTPPTWIKPGTPARYHPTIGRPDSRRVIITSEPTKLGGHTWCVMVDRMAGLVACEALTPIKDDPDAP